MSDREPDPELAAAEIQRLQGKIWRGRPAMTERDWVRRATGTPAGDGSWYPECDTERVPVLCRVCFAHLGGPSVAARVRWGVCADCTGSTEPNG